MWCTLLPKTGTNPETWRSRPQSGVRPSSRLQMCLATRLLCITYFSRAIMHVTTAGTSARAMHVTPRGTDCAVPKAGSLAIHKRQICMQFCKIPRAVQSSHFLRSCGKPTCEAHRHETVCVYACLSHICPRIGDTWEPFHLGLFQDETPGVGSRSPAVIRAGRFQLPQLNHSQHLILS